MNARSNEAEVGGSRGDDGVIRLAVVQLEMRTLAGSGAFVDQVGGFCRAAGEAGADFVVFPEYVNAPMMGGHSDLGAGGAIRALAESSGEVRRFFSEAAQESGVNVVTGSLPLIEDGRLYNVAYLCRRDGSCDVQYKLHITPNEEEEWGMSGGERLEVFDTDCGKVGILICYDSEFPELGRVLADQGVEILFVPFCTDGEDGYQRVRLCSQARAIENECYVAISGSVGELAGVPNMDFHYARSAVFSPSDEGFPAGGVVCEAGSGTETMLLAEVDLKALHRVRKSGSVRNLSQRRWDLVRTEWSGPSGAGSP